LSGRGTRFSLNTQFSILVLLLVIPSLILMVFWLRILWEERGDIQTAQQGLDLISTFDRLLLPEIDEPDADHSAFKAALNDISASLPDAQRNLVFGRIDDLQEDPTFLDAVNIVRSLTFSISRDVELEAMTPSAADALPDLITSQLLETIAQTQRTTQVLRRMAARDDFNPWDRMAVPVQAGQFKMMADSVGRVTREHFGPEATAFSANLISQAEAYRDANQAMQSAFGAQVQLMPMVQTGADLSVDAINVAHQEIIGVSLEFWRLAVDQLAVQLDQALSAKNQRILETAALGAAIVLTALVAVVLVGRAFRNRTLSEIAFAYRFDELTGLPNRRSLLIDLKKIVEEHRDSENVELALYQIDLVRFALINDTYGEEYGDHALKLVADSLAELTEEGSLYRLGGNSFGCLNWAPGNWEHDAFAEKIEARIASACKSLNPDLVLSAHIGVATARLSGLSALEILNDASIALAAAKEDDKSRVKLFGPDVRDGLLRRQRFETELAHALDAGHLEAWLQPQVSAVDHTVVGAEALARWNDPEKGLINPGDFLPMAEEMQMIEQIDDVVREEAMATISDLNLLLGRSLQLGVNVTSALLENPGSVAHLKDQVERHGLAPSMIDLEVLETIAVDNEKSVIPATLEALSKHGFRIAGRFWNGARKLVEPARSERSSDQGGPKLCVGHRQEQRFADFYQCADPTRAEPEHRSPR